MVIKEPAEREGQFFFIICHSRNLVVGGGITVEHSKSENSWSFSSSQRSQTNASMEVAILPIYIIYVCSSLQSAFCNVNTTLLCEWSNIIDEFCTYVLVFQKVYVIMWQRRRRRRRTHHILVAGNTNTFLHTNTNTNTKIKKSPGSLSEVGTFPHFE